MLVDGSSNSNKLLKHLSPVRDLSASFPQVEVGVLPKHEPDTPQWLTLELARSGPLCAGLHLAEHAGIFLKI